MNTAGCELFDLLYHTTPARRMDAARQTADRLRAAIGVTADLLQDHLRHAEHPSQINHGLVFQVGLALQDLAGLVSELDISARVRLRALQEEDPAS
jgi:hypothetical protein